MIVPYRTIIRWVPNTAGHFLISRWVAIISGRFRIKKGKVDFRHSCCSPLSLARNLIGDTAIPNDIPLGPKHRRSFFNISLGRHHRRSFSLTKTQGGRSSGRLMLEVAGAVLFLLEPPPVNFVNFVGVLSPVVWKLDLPPVVFVEVPRALGLILEQPLVIFALQETVLPVV